MYVCTFSLPSITCPNCVKGISTHLSTTPSLWFHKFSIDLPEKKISIVLKHEEDEALAFNDLQEKLNEIGHFCEKITQKKQELTFFQQVKTWFLSHQFKGLFGTSLGLMMMVVMLIWPSMSFGLMASLSMISIAVTLFLGIESFKAAWLTWKLRQPLTMDTLFAISTATVIGVSLASFWLTWLPMMFDAGLLIFGFRHIGRAIEASLCQKMALSLSFRDRVKNRFQAFDVEHDIFVSALKLNDKIWLEKGDVIPVDGVCESEEAWIFDTITTGATTPRKVTAGMTLLAGMRIADHSPRMVLKVQSLAQHSYLAKLDKAIEAAKSEKASSIEENTARQLQYFIPVVLTIALLSGLTLAYFFNIPLAIQCAVSVLVSACPCTLGFITPLIMKIGLQKGFEYGVHYKSADALERAASIDTVVFDLNGTLTTGVPQVKGMFVLDASISKQTLLAAVHGLENQAVHPVGKILSEYQRELIDFSGVKPVKNLVVEHSGISAKIDDDHWCIGNQDMMTKMGYVLPKVPHVSPGESLTYLAKNGKIVSYFVVCDPLHPQALETVAQLHRAGYSVHMCTGADEVTALRYGALLGISPKNILAGCVGGSEEASPKVNYIKALKQKNYKVAMVGDAANDAVAVKESHFGIAVQSKSIDEMTEAHAGVLLEQGALLPVANCLKIAKKTVKKIETSLFASLVYNMLSVFLASGVFIGFGFALHPCIGAALMILQTSAVLLHAYMFKEAPLETPYPQTQKETGSSIQSISGSEQINSARLSNRLPIAHSSKNLTASLESDGHGLDTMSQSPLRV